MCWCLRNVENKKIAHPLSHMCWWSWCCACANEWVITRRRALKRVVCVAGWSSRSRVCLIKYCVHKVVRTARDQMGQILQQYPQSFSIVPKFVSAETKSESRIKTASRCIVIVVAAHFVYSVRVRSCVFFALFIKHNIKHTFDI